MRNSTFKRLLAIGVAACLCLTAPLPAAASMQFDVVLRTNRIAQIQATIGSSGTLKIYTGAPPANCTVAEAGSLLVTITLPAVFLTAANGAATITNGPWTGTAVGTGMAGSFRMLDGSGVCRVQGDTLSDLVLANTSIAISQPVTVTTFTPTDGNQ